MLEHHADAEPSRGAGIGNALGRAVEDDLALVRGEDAVDHLDQGRLAGAVFAEKRVNFAGFDAQANVIVGADAWERLADADKLQSQGSFSLHLDTPSLPRLAPLCPAR